MVSPTLRESIRALYDFRCGYCGVTETESGSELDVDHFRPRSQGGLVKPAVMWADWPLHNFEVGGAVRHVPGPGHLRVHMPHARQRGRRLQRAAGSRRGDVLPRGVWPECGRVVYGGAGGVATPRTGGHGSSLCPPGTDGGVS